MCYRPLLAKPIIRYKRGWWRVTWSGHDDLDVAAQEHVHKLNGLA